LEILDIDAWKKQKTIPKVKEGDKISKFTLTMEEGATTPPSLLTEADLISRMDEHGIGTDATIHEHIKNV
jgi:DNA topoisomerase-3